MRDRPVELQASNLSTSVLDVANVQPVEVVY